jgi:hypothetical protein
MDRQVKYWEGKSFSGEDVNRLCDGKVRIMTYRDLLKYPTLESAWGAHKALIVLYETRERYGHWVCCFEVKPGLVEYFDPYGMLFDDPLGYIDEDFKESSGVIPWLTKLVTDYGDCIYNDIQLQEFKHATNTCGRWVGFRICMRKLPLDQFVRQFEDQTFKPDWYVTAFTMFV